MAVPSTKASGTFSPMCAMRARLKALKPMSAALPASRGAGQADFEHLLSVYFMGYSRHSATMSASTWSRNRRPACISASAAASRLRAHSAKA
jgi:hypothetical protein